MGETTMTTTLKLAPAVPSAVTSAADIHTLRTFVEHETDLLDRQDFDAWVNLFAEDGAYWVPAERGQLDFLSNVSIFYDDKTILKTRAARLAHEMIHCQDPASSCVRVVSSFNIDTTQKEHDDGLVAVTSKFIMLEDRFTAPRRFFGGRYRHVLRPVAQGFEIVLKKVELTNCDQSFPALTQPF